ncbi:hypothetical protein C8R47DRAFT_589301 [Mycena vitilis]|nr:hypothetical protein C8R47DRAFT_589301 [Mycena vitilis]
MHRDRVFRPVSQTRSYWDPQCSRSRSTSPLTICVPSFKVPLGLNQVYTIAAAFITDCPSTNPKLPVMAFPTLKVTTTRYSPGKNISLEFTPSTPVAAGTPLHVAFYTGLSVEYAPLTSDNKVVIPEDLLGQVYAVVTTNGTAVHDGDTLAGLEFNSSGKLMM